MRTLTPLEALDAAIEMLKTIAKGGTYSVLAYHERVLELEQARDAAHEQAMKDEQVRAAVREHQRRQG